MTGTQEKTIRQIKEGTWEGVFFFHPNDGIYGEHFPGYPVVPGSLIVHAFLKVWEQAGFSGDAITIENFTFREFLLPGHYPFRIELRKDRLHCLISREDKKMVTGILRR